MAEATPPSLSPEDFERIQESLLNLKTQNYALNDQCRKQGNALGEAMAKIRVLEQELEKSQRAVQKSKKASEVQMLMQEKNSLQRKLQSQEDEFRLQNQTLLTELSNLVTTNEKMEQEIKCLEDPKDSTQPYRPLTTEIASLKAEREQLQKELSLSQDQLKQAKNEITRLNDINNQLDRKSEEVVQVNSRGGVSFRRQKSNLTEDDLNSDSSSIKEVNNSEMQQKLSETQKNLTKFLEQNSQLESKLEHNNHVIKDKQSQIDKLNEKVEELSQNCDKSEERNIIEKLQKQLDHGYATFDEYKRSKGSEILALKEEINSLQTKMNGMVTDDIRQSLEAKLAGARLEIAQSNKTKDVLQSDKDILKERVTRLDAELEQHTKDQSKMKSDLEEAMKTSNSRKNLLDEMAIAMETKESKARAEILELKEKNQSTEAFLNETKKQVEQLQDERKVLQSSESQLINSEKELKAKLGAANDEMKQINEANKAEMEAMKSAHEDMIKALESEKKIEIRDINMQLEISNAQRSEFEENNSILHEEVKDLQEEKKIIEKKQIGLVKDLKKQLLSEKQQNDRLQEKIKECLSQAPCPEPPGNKEVDPDRTSISSWSMMSGPNDISHPQSRSTPIPTPSSNISSPQNAESLPTDSPRTTSPGHAMGEGEKVSVASDHRLLLGKISTLQEERAVYIEKISFLEHSSSAMADELLKKSALINYYCMQGGKAVAKTSTASSDKGEMVRKMVKNLVHPDVETRREIQRMQNMLEETLTKNMHLQADVENLSQQVVDLSRLAAAREDRITDE